MSWPLSQDYNEAIQSPAGNFTDADLRRGEAVCNALGLPMPYSGNFADVYQVRCPDGSRWAVKCFTREALGLRERYQEISGHLKQARLPFTVDFSYLEQGMRVAGQWYPVLKMQWVEGLTLNQFVSQYLDKPATLEALLHLWGKMATYLRAAEVGHCDLQHGNVLLVPGSDSHSLKLKLIDYDGMWVPALAGKKSGEVGHPSYQHPQRMREGTYSMEVDRFPVLLVAAALRALKAKGKGLWDKYDNGDNLLFKESDLREPAQAAVFQELLHLGDPATVVVTAPLVKSLWARLELVPLLAEVLPDVKPAATPAPIRMARPVTPAPATRAVPVSPEKAFAFDDSTSPTPGASSTRLNRPPSKLWEILAGVPVWARVVGALAGSAVAVVVFGALLWFLTTHTSSPDKPPPASPVAQVQSTEVNTPGPKPVPVQAAENAPNKAPEDDALRAKMLFEQGTQFYRAGNFAAAVPLFLEAARLGDVAAQLQVGWHYEFGKGVRQNPAEAVRWYLAAAKQGNPIAQSNVGTMLENGSGVAEDWMAAAYWYAQSAKQDDDAGLYNLGRAYEFGIGVPQNRSTALSLYRKSAAKGNANGAAAFRQLRQLGSVSFRSDREREVFGLLPDNLPRDPAGRVFHNSDERLAYLKGEKQANDADQAWRTYDLDMRFYDQHKREYDEGRRNDRPTEPTPPAFPRP